MPIMTSFEFGDIVLAPFPFTNQTASKKRPAVIVSSLAYHRQRLDLIIMAITSQVRHPASLGEVVIADWKEAGLLKPSVIKPVLTTIERGLLLRTLGRLRESDQQALVEALRVIIGR